jgi:hypothetical protein
MVLRQVLPKYTSVFRVDIIPPILHSHSSTKDLVQLEHLVASLRETPPSLCDFFSLLQGR